MENNIMINASFLPTENLIGTIKKLKKNQAIFKENEIIAFYTTDTQKEVDFDSYQIINFTDDIIQIKCHFY